MKLSTAIILASATMVAAKKKINGKNAAKILRHARRVEEEDGEEAELDLSYIMNYDIKMLSCVEGEAIVNPEDGEVDYGAVTIRLCPTDGGCDDEKACKKGFGDYVVSARTFTEAWLEDQKDNMDWGDDWFNPEEYTECREYEPEEDEDGEEDENEQEMQYFIGVGCTEDGDDIRFALFEDEDCRYESEEDFAEVSNGWSLPYAEGGLVTTSCVACSAYNDDGEAELREMCEQVYEESYYKCETEMEFVSYYGADEQGCEYIEELAQTLKGDGISAGKVIGWIILALIVVGSCSYISWWRKKKSGASDGLVA